MMKSALIKDLYFEIDRLKQGWLLLRLLLLSLFVKGIYFLRLTIDYVFLF